MRPATFIIAALLAAAPVQAQSITGQILDTDGAAPIAGALVTVRDSARHVRARMLTDQNGLFRADLTAGKYQVAVEHIGFQPASRAVDVAGSSATQVKFSLSPAAIALKEIVVQSKNQCRTTEDPGAARLWYFARTALGASTAETTRNYKLRHFTRQLDANLKQIGDEEMRFSDATGKYTYRAVSRDSLLRYGFVQWRGSLQAYMGPDAEVLLSDEFVNAHCFGVERDRNHAGLVGLSFWPHADRKQPDIRGTLWLNEDTGYLQYVEYHFTNLPFDIDQRLAGGRVDFERLPDRTWIVRRWYIRMPRTREAGPSVGGVTIAGATEEGAEVLSFAARKTETRGTGRIAGVVYDSVQARPLANALVYLSGTSYSTKTNAQGEFVLDNVPAGEHYLSFHEARLTGLPRFNNTQRVLVVRDSTRDIKLAVPSAQTLLASACSAEERAEAARAFSLPAQQLGVLTGSVRERGRAVSGARVELELSGRNAHVVWAQTNARGDYAICGYPPGNNALVSVIADGDVVQRKMLSRDASLPARRLDFDIVR